MGFVVDKAALGQVFCEYFGFLLSRIPPSAPESSSIIRARYTRLVVDSSFTEPQKVKKKMNEWIVTWDGM
jgi:hypothetical protein